MQRLNGTGRLLFVPLFLFFSLFGLTVHAAEVDPIWTSAEPGYVKLGGRSGGQIIYGGVSANNTLILQANSAAGNTPTSVGLQFIAGNTTTAMTILNNGNVGIGTINPNPISTFGRVLEISATTTKGGMLVLKATQNGSNIKAFGIGSEIINSAPVLSFYNSSTLKMVMNDNGYFGIATTTPIALLTLGDAGAAITSGINFQGDVNLYRAQANVLATDDAFTINQPTTANGLIINRGTSSAQLRVSGGSSEIVQYGAVNSNITRATFGVGGLDFTLGATFDMYSDGTILFLGDGGTEFARFTSAGKFGIGLTSVDTNYLFQLPNSSSAKAKANAWDTYSDGRIKQNQKPLKYGLSEVLKLSPKQYIQRDSTWKNGKLILSGGQDTVGFIAQEVNKILPEVVQKPTDESKELWSMDYSKIVPVLVHAIQEQQVEIEKLELEIKAIKAGR